MKGVAFAVSAGSITVAMVSVPIFAQPADAGLLTAPTVRSPAALGGDTDAARTLAAPTVHTPTSGINDAPQGPATPTLPGVGPQTMAQIPQDTTQVVVATTPEATGTNARVTVYNKSADGWHKVKEFAGHNGAAGWRENRTEGDETTPAGVFALSDAGGALKDPGSKLPYSHDRNLSASAVSVYGPDYAEVFDYVIAVDYNRRPGTPPTNPERPEGREKGGGIWFHVDHGDPTHGCITVSKEGMVWLLRNIDPANNPYTVLGDQKFIAA